MDVSGSDRFLAAFNRIEMWLEAQSGSGRSVPFYRLVEQARGRNALVRRLEGDTILRIVGSVRRRCWGLSRGGI